MTIEYNFHARGRHLKFEVLEIIFEINDSKNTLYNVSDFSIFEQVSHASIQVCMPYHFAF